jgi:arsenate reductase
MIILHNNRCSKSREALALLNDNNCEVEIRDYLKDPLSKKEIKELLAKLKCKPLDIIRKKETIFTDKFADKKLSDDKWIDVMVKYPILIERPIVINGKKAIVGRPPALIKDII